MFKLAKTLTKRPHSSSIPITPNNQQQQQQEFESPPKKAKTTSTAPDASISPTSSQALLHELFLERKSRSLAPITTEGESEGAQEPTTYSTTKEIENSFEIYVNWLKKIQSFIDNLELINGKLKQFDLSKPEDFGRIAPMEILGTLIDLQELLVRYSSILSNPVNSNHLQSSPLLTLLVHKTKLLPELIPQVNFYIENGQLNYVQQHINFNLIYSLIKKQLELFNQYKIKEAISKELLIKTNPEPMPRTPKLSSKSDNFVQNFLLEEEEESASPKSDPIERQLNQIRSADQTLSHEKGKEKISSKKLVSANPVNNSASPNPAYASHSNDFSVIKPAGKLPPIACLQQTPSTFKVPRKKKPTLEIKQESSPLSSINRAEHAVSETSLYHFFHNNLPILSNTEEHSPTISNWLLINSQISTTVGNIPIEVWQLILNYVNPEDMITVIPFVSRTFNHLSKNPNIWTERFIREFPQRCQSHHNTYLKPVGRATKEDFVRNYRAEYAKFTEKSRSASYHPALPRLISLLQDNTLEMSDFEKISNRFGVSSPTLEHLFYPISQSGFSFVDLCQRQNNTAAFNYIFKRYLQETHKVDEAADVTQPNMKGFRGMNLLHIAIVSHQIDLAKFLLKQFKVTQDGNSALHLAVEAGNLSIIKELVEIHHLDINRCNAMGYTPLYLACKNGYTSIVEYLNDKGAIIPNTTPLHIAAEWGHLSVVEFLLKSFGMDVNSKDNEGCTALHLAAKHGRNSIIQLLLAEGADLKALTNKRETVFFCAAQGNNSVTIQLLSECDIFLANEDNKTPLEIAAQVGHPLVVEAIVGLYRQSLGASQKINRSFYLAAEAGRADNAEALRKCGADIDRFCPFSGLTPLHIAAIKGNIAVMHLLLTKSPVRARPAAMNKTPLICAIEAGQCEAVKCLLDYHTPIFGIEYTKADELVNAGQKQEGLRIIDLLNNSGQTVIIERQRKKLEEKSTAKPQPH